MTGSSKERDLPDWVIKQKEDRKRCFNRDERPGKIAEFSKEFGLDIAEAYVDYIEGAVLSNTFTEKETKPAFVEAIALAIDGDLESRKKAILALLSASRAISYEAAIDTLPFDSLPQI